MKKIISIMLSTITILLVLLVACNMVTYEGPYNQDGYFDGTKSAYLLIEKPTDTLQSYSFAIRPTEESEHTFKVPVRILGRPTNSETRVGVTIVQEKSNAVLGTHFKPIAKEVIIPADSIKGYIEVTMLRDALNKKETTKTYLTLSLTPTSDYQIVEGERNEVTLSVDDFFDDAELEEYWNNYFAGILGIYNRTVYLKLLESYGWDTALLNSEFFQTTRFWTNWAMTVRYFEQHPELGIEIVLADWLEGYLPYLD